jgi:hypothetical protein
VKVCSLRCIYIQVDVPPLDPVSRYSARTTRADNQDFLGLGWELMMRIAHLYGGLVRVLGSEGAVDEITH